jgi:hypothetical protein
MRIQLEIVHGWGQRLFRRLFGSRKSVPDQPPTRDDDRPGSIPQGMEVTVSEGRAGLEVVGESNYQDELWPMVGGRGNPEDRVRVDIVAVLVAETDNPFDSNAVSVWVNGLKVGYLSRADAERYRPGLIALESRYGRPVALRGIIAGGGMRADGQGRLGVFLRHDPSDFGLDAPKSSPLPRMDTGLTDARATDAADESYDLSWVGDLPEDPIRAIPMLRQLLAREQDPIDRHFVFHQLETTLYKSRDAFASALTEYDECCRQHDAEMQSIRDAFMLKWGKIPWLHTYKQACIRLAKAKEFEQALWWAERGLAVYGQDAGRPDAVEDLRKRAEAYRTRLARS